MAEFRHSPADHLGAVTREIHDGERDGQPLRVLVAERAYDATVEEVWDAVTTPERIPRWLGPVSGDLTPGGRFQVEGNAGGDILVCDPPRHLALTWEYGGQVSWVEVYLSQRPGSATVRLEHSAAVPPELWEQYGPGAVGIGWEMMLMGLTEHLASPDFAASDAQSALASTDGQAWMGSFLSGSSRAWERASVVAGTEPGRASAAGQRCLGFYTGTEDQAEA